MQPYATKTLVPQNEIPVSDPPGWKEEGRIITSTLSCKINADVKSETIPFLFVLTNVYKGFNTDDTQDGTYSEGMNISVCADCTITFRIDATIEKFKDRIRFSEKYTALTAKGNLRDWPDYYGGWDEKNQSLKVRERPEFPGKEPERDGFNLNIDIYQGTDEKGNAIWLPVTLDPDVINPKPPH